MGELSSGEEKSLVHSHVVEVMTMFDGYGYELGLQLLEGYCLNPGSATY